MSLIGAVVLVSCEQSGPTGPPPPDHLRFSFFTEPIFAGVWPACYGVETGQDRVPGSNPEHAQAAQVRGAGMYAGGLIVPEAQMTELGELYAAMLMLQNETDVRRIAAYTEAVETMMERLDCDWVGHAHLVVGGTGALATYQDLRNVRLSPMKITKSQGGRLYGPNDNVPNGLRDGQYAFWPAEFLIPEAYY